MVPNKLRVFFKFRRKLLGDLCRCAVNTLTVHLQAVSGEDLVPGIIAAIQTFGDQLNFHPHLHFLVSEGGADGAAAFHKVSQFEERRLGEVFGHEVVALLIRKELISPKRRRGFLSGGVRVLGSQPR